MKYVFTLMCILLASVDTQAQNRRRPFCSPIDVGSPQASSAISLIKECSPGQKSDCNPVTEHCALSWLTLEKKDTIHYIFTLTDSSIIARHPRPNVTWFTQDAALLTKSGANHFWGVDFLESDFYLSRFRGQLLFWGCWFKYDANFYHSIFQANTQFRGSTFSKNVSFEYAQFDDNVSFEEVTFGDDVSFKRATFQMYTSFKEAAFNRIPRFLSVSLPDTLDFRNVSFNYPEGYNIAGDKIDFRRAVARLDPQKKMIKCVILLAGTDISQLLLPYDRFQIVFDSTLSYEQIVSTYEILINSCKSAGMIESAQGWDIENRRVQNIHNYWFLNFGYFANFFNWAWWDFGYAKWRILLVWLPLFFVCFMLYNLIYIERLCDKMYNDPELGINFKSKAGKSPKPIFKDWKKRFSFTFFYTAVIYFGFKIRHESVNYNYTRGLLYLYLMYAVGTIHMAFAFSYILSAY